VSLPRVATLDRWCRRALVDVADTLPQGCLEVDRPAMLAEKIGERLVGKLLEVPHAVPGEQVEGIPSLLIELNAFSWHRGILLRDNSATLWQFPAGVASR
jgi:hypothetical protein